MDVKVNDKEEIKKRLEEMKLNYAKIQRKLSKSERRQKAKNHVRRVLAEQANTPCSAELFGSTPSPCERTDSHERRKDRDTEDAAKMTLHRSISFKLEEMLDETDDEGRDCRDATWRIHGHDTGGVPTRDVQEQSADGVDAMDGNRTKDDSDGDCATAFKVCRRSHGKRSRWKSKVDEVVNRSSSVGRDAGRASWMGCGEGFLRYISEDASESADEIPDISQKLDAVDEVTGKEENTGDRVCLRRMGIFQGSNRPSCLGSWDAVCLQLRSYTALVLHQGRLAVLWTYTNTWEARSQWQVDPGVVITDVALGHDPESQLSLVFTLKKGSLNEVYVVAYNLESDTENMRKMNLPGKLHEAENIVILLHGGDGGAVVEKTDSHYDHIHFFDKCAGLSLWQIEDLKLETVLSFISVKGTPHLYLCLSSSRLSLWSSKSDLSLLEVNLDKSMEVQMDQCLWSKTEGGLLFFISSMKPSSLSLFVLNPTSRSGILEVYRFMPPCAYHSLSMTAISISKQFLAVLFSNQKTLIWDIYSGHPVAEIPSLDEQTSKVISTPDFLFINGKEPCVYQFGHLSSSSRGVP